MRIIITLFFVILVACQTQDSKTKSSNNATSKPKVLQTVASEENDSKNENTARWKCNEEICLQLRNHDDASTPWWKFWAKSNQSLDVDIYMINSIPIAGFQCDLDGV